MIFRVISQEGEVSEFDTLERARSFALDHAQKLITLGRPDGTSVWVHDEEDRIVGTAKVHRAVSWTPGND